MSDPRPTTRQFRFTDAERGDLCRSLMLAIEYVQKEFPPGEERVRHLRHLRALLDRLSN